MLTFSKIKNYHNDNKADNGNSDGWGSGSGSGDGWGGGSGWGDGWGCGSGWGDRG